jgi:predicted aspartyl protease
MTLPYDASYDPPALIVPAVLSGVVRNRPKVQLPALIDTGAELTAVPNSAVNRLRLYAVDRIEVEDIHARVETVDIYTVRITVTDMPVREMEVVPTNQPFVILGRDWLEDYYLLLNGPDHSFLLSNTPLVTQP